MKEISLQPSRPFFKYVYQTPSRAGLGPNAITSQLWHLMNDLRFSAPEPPENGEATGQQGVEAGAGVEGGDDIHGGGRKFGEGKKRRRGRTGAAAIGRGGVGGVVGGGAGGWLGEAEGGEESLGQVAAEVIEKAFAREAASASASAASSVAAESSGNSGACAAAATTVANAAAVVEAAAAPGAGDTDDADAATTVAAADAATVTAAATANIGNAASVVDAAAASVATDAVAAAYSLGEGTADVTSESVPTPEELSEEGYYDKDAAAASDPIVGLVYSVTKKTNEDRRQRDEGGNAFVGSSTEPTRSVLQSCFILMDLHCALGVHQPYFMRLIPLLRSSRPHP